MAQRRNPNSMTLETPRLILRPFAADDLDRMAELMANKDFMRFSTVGPMTREQTQNFLDEVIGWDGDGLSSQFAMILRSSGAGLGYCGSFHHAFDRRLEVEFGYGLHR